MHVPLYQHTLYISCGLKSTCYAALGTYLDQDLVVLQSLKVLLCHLDEEHIRVLVLHKVELDAAPGVLHSNGVNEGQQSTA